MDEILFITNGTTYAPELKFAQQFASQNGKDLVVAQINRFEPVYLLAYEPALKYHADLGKQQPFDISPRLQDGQYSSPFKTIDISYFTESMLAAHIRQKGYAMVISHPGIGDLNFQTVINQINCPLMLLPDSPTVSEIKRMVYLTDLRYCQQQVLSYLDKFKRSSVLLAHICEKGLPDLAPSYGNQLFNDTARNHASRPELFFSHIKESNMEKMIDTLINTMGTDMLVCLNRRFHFQQLLGEDIPGRLPEHITVPVLIFPC